MASLWQTRMKYVSQTLPENSVMSDGKWATWPLFSLEPITPTYAKNKPTFASALLILGPPVAPHGAHWNRHEKVNFHMPHLGPFNVFSKKSFKVGSEKRFVV